MGLRSHTARCAHHAGDRPRSRSRPRRLLHGTGLTPAAVEDPDTQVATEQELTVDRNLLAALGEEPGLGVETGLRYTIGTTGILGFALLSSPTMREAIITGLRHITGTGLSAWRRTRPLPPDALTNRDQVAASTDVATVAT